MDITTRSNLRGQAVYSRTLAQKRTGNVSNDQEIRGLFRQQQELLLRLTVCVDRLTDEMQSLDERLATIEDWMLETRVPKRRSAKPQPMPIAKIN
jgi:hypothetical protein